jgi:D-proline reductase (dithiol) PrdB
MARTEDLPEQLRHGIADLECPNFEQTPFVMGPPLAQRRVAVVNSAAMIERGGQPFRVDGGEWRPIARTASTDDLLISHVSINFDRSGFQRDINVVYPIDRLAELASAGVIGSVADTHFTVMGSDDPADLAEAASQMITAFRADQVDAVLFTPA